MEDDSRLAGFCRSFYTLFNPRGVCAPVPLLCYSCRGKLYWMLFMTLTALRLFLRLNTVVFSSVFFMLTGCATQLPIKAQGQQVTNDQSVGLAQSSPVLKALAPIEPSANLVPIVKDITEQKSGVVKNDTAKTQVSEVEVEVEVNNTQPSDGVAFLLGEAGWAFSNDKLTTPKGESAYYFLTQVLDRNPDNPQALDALEKIVQRYYELLRNSLKKGKLDQARVFWSRAKKVKPQHQKLNEMKALIDDYAVTKKLTAAPELVTKKLLKPVSGPVTKTPTMRTQRLPLPAKLIGQQDEHLAKWLITVAQQAQKLQATILIVAPKDNQARWVYKVMNGADPEQRIRANIKHSKPVRLEVTYLARKDELEIYSN